MNKEKNNNEVLTEHLFREEFGKIVSVIIKFLGVGNIHIAEEIAQETFYRAVKHWQHNGVPPDPKAWLYVTAKNICLNRFSKNKLHKVYSEEVINTKAAYSEDETLVFSEEIIADGQLRMMFACCHKSISREAQLSLILKILCGFSISEIAHAFFSSTETINKRLVRARKKLKEQQINFNIPIQIENDLATVLEAIYLLFNEGYSPSEKNAIVRKDLCFEAIRLAELLKDNAMLTNKDDCYALLSLMYLNAARFESRYDERNEAIEMKHQDRSLWNKALIDQGIRYLNKGMESAKATIYHLLAAISAQHCIAREYHQTNWTEILSLYDALLIIKDSALVRLNRTVALAKVNGNQMAIEELVQLKKNTSVDAYHLYHSTIAEFYLEEKDFENASKHFKKAISLARSKRDIDFLKKKLEQLVPI